MKKEYFRFIVLTIVFTLFYQLGGAVEASAYTSDFPSLHITTTGDGEPFTVRELWIDAIFTVTGGTNEDWHFEGETGRIRGRGNSTWNAAWAREKRPLRLRFDNHQALMGADYPARDWVTFANAGDPSLLRNHVALTLGSILDGMYWTPYSQFLHLYVNDVYMGVYQLTDERDIGPARARIVVNEDPTLSEYLFETFGHNGGWSEEGEGIEFIRVNSRPEGAHGGPFVGIGGTLAAQRANDTFYEIRYPSNATPEHLEFLGDFMLRVGQAVRALDFETVKTLIDVDSFVDFYILNEIVRDTDFPTGSVFRQLKDSGEGLRLHMGPIWDFDGSLGNQDFLRTRATAHFRVRDVHYHFYYLMQIPEFYELVLNRWNTVARDAVAYTVTHINELAREYQSAFERNFRYFNMYAHGQHLREIDTFMGQVEYLSGWLTERADWIDSYFNPEPLLLSENYIPALPIMRDILVNGEPVEFPAYSIDDRDFFSIRNIANILDETSVGFGVNWWTAGFAFISVDSTIEQTQTDADTRALASGFNAHSTNARVNINFKEFNLPAYNINGDNFFSLRSFADILGYEIEWDNDAKTVIITE